MEIVLLAMVSVVWPYSGKVGDFAPLKVGNQWQYEGTSRLKAWRSVPSGSNAILRSVAVDSSYQAGDTTWFVIHILDSLYERVTIRNNGHDTVMLADTIVEMGFRVPEVGDSLINQHHPYSMEYWMLYKHLLPESEVALDTGEYKDRQVFVTGSNSVRSYLLLKDVGLARFDYANVGGEVGNYYQSFRLIRFNDLTFPSAIFPVFKAARTRNIAKDRPFLFPTFRGWSDALGRARPVDASSR